jgi:hypothetical protein
MLIAIIRTWDYIYVILLWGLYGALPAHEACTHELNASPSPSKCEFKAIPFSVRQYSDNFGI